MTTIHLIKSDISIPWGFRLQGGKDFGAPLTVQRINPGSVAARCGLQIGDVIASINDVLTPGLKHKDAQDLIIKGETSIQLVVNREGSSSNKVSAPVTSVVDKNPPRAPVFYDAPKRNPDGFGSGLSDGGRNTPPSSQKSDPFGANRSTDVSKSSNDSSIKYIPSTTCQLVRDLDAGRDTGVNPVTGAKIRSSPAQSKLHHQLEKQCQIDSTTESNKPTSSSSNGSSSSSGLKGPTPFSTKPTASVTVPPVPHSSPPAPIPQGGTSPAPKGTTTQRDTPSEAQSGKNDIVQKISSVSRIPVCHVCNSTITGQYMTAIGKIWCREHFACHKCSRSLMSIEFFEDNGNLFCREDYEDIFAPRCSKCDKPISEEAVNAMGKTFHVTCFVCAKCQKPIQGGSFHLNHGEPYCQKDWETLFQTKCQSCQFAIEPGDQWIEALGSNWHAECFNCSVCKKNLESVGFYNKNGQPCCKDH